MLGFKRHIKPILVASLMSVAFSASAFAVQPAHSKGKSKGLSKGLTKHIEMPLSAPGFMPAERNALPKWAQSKVSMSQAKSAALSRYPGAKYLDMYLDGNVYRVKLLLQNREVVEVVVDARTGRVR